VIVCIVAVSVTVCSAAGSVQLPEGTVCVTVCSVAVSDQLSEGTLCVTVCSLAVSVPVSEGTVCVQYVVWQLVSNCLKALAV